MELKGPPMKIKVDFDLCESNGLCEAMAPEVFELDDDDFLQLHTEQTTDENGLIQVALTGRDGAVICGEACGEIPVTEPALLLSRIITVESVAGLTVPSAALVTDAAGEVAVIDESGERRPVQVVTSARGMSVIEGVDAGLRVRVPATEG